MSCGRIKLLLFFFTFGIVSCATNAKVSAEFENDLNADGKQDYFVEYKDGFTYELYDRNFDTKIDESIKYSANFYKTISAKLDDNFDGILETLIIYDKGLISKVCVDTNKNQYADTIFHYESGVLKRAKKYYKKIEGSSNARVGYLKFSFGYPSSQEEFSEVRISEEDFSSKNRCK